MKKPLLIILILISTIELYSQNYKFNLLTNYKSDNGFYKERNVYSNKENDSYFLVIRKFKNQKIAYLEDLRSSYGHRFKVLESNINGNETTFQFIYENTYKITDRNISFMHDFKVVKRDSLSKTVKIITYKNKRKKKIIHTAELTIKDSRFNLFSVFRYSCLHPYEQFIEFSFNENGIVESYKSLDSNEPVYIYLDGFLDLKEFELRVGI